eukprot:3595436-Prymnesium_polylepis.1
MPCGRDEILRAIQLGDDHGRVDFAIPMGPSVLLVDWDGAICHGIDRLQGDVRKTRRMLHGDHGASPI